MDSDIKEKIILFSELSFDDAKEIILHLVIQLKQSDDDIFGHILETLPYLTEKELEKKVLIDIYREIVMANDAVNAEDREKALKNLSSHQEKIQKMLEQEKADRTNELKELDHILSTL